MLSICRLTAQFRLVPEVNATGGAVSPNSAWLCCHHIVSLQLKKAQAEAADATTQLAAVDQLLKTLKAGDLDAIKRQYVDAARKMAVTQVCGPICNMPHQQLHVQDAVSNCYWTRLHPACSSTKCTSCADGSVPGLAAPAAQACQAGKAAGVCCCSRKGCQ